MQARVSFITLGVADMPRARAFYEAMGLEAGSPSNDNVTFFQLSQGVVLSLFGADSLAHDAGRAGEVSQGVGITLAHNVRSEKEVDAVLAQAERAGGCITQPAAMAPWGVYRGYFADPDGHPWEVAFNDRITWDERGGVWLP